MALTNLTDRNTTALMANQNTHLGPGSYEMENSLSILDKRVKSIRPPPFGQGAGIKTEAPNSYLAHKFTPGPGQYDLQTSFDQQIVNTDKQKGIYFVIKNGMLQRKTEWLSADKTKKGSAFLNQQTSSNSPGPGAYSPRNSQNISFEKANRMRNQKRVIKGQFMSTLKTSGIKLTTVPSIPTKSQLLIIQPNEDGSNQDQSNVSTNQIKSVIQVNKSQSNMALPNKPTNPFQEYSPDVNIGPGSYDPMIPSKKNSSQGAWAKSNQQRKLWFEQSIEQQKKQMPGVRNNLPNQSTNIVTTDSLGIEKDEKLIELEHQIRQERQIKKSVQMGNKRWKTTKGRPFSIGDYDTKFAGTEIDEDEEGQDDYDGSKEVSPGPGHYYNNARLSSIKPQYKDIRHQYFGSTEDRFKGSIFQGDDHHKGTTAYIGPGSYNIRQEDQKQKREQQINREDSNTQQVREIKRVFDVDQEIIGKPGPGNYEPTEDAFAKKKDFQKPFQSAFGSSDSRKIHSTTDTLSPGPGTYNQEQRGSKQKIGSSSIFKSQTKRSIEQYLVNDPTLPSGADYNLQHFKGTSYQQLQGGAPNNILVLKRAVQKQGERIDYNSLNTSKVISNVTTLDQYQNIGPGAYSPNHYESFQPGTKNTFGKSNRFEEKEKMRRMPGPGHYSNMPYTDPSDWHKRSFNLRYLTNGTEVMRSKSQLNNSAL